jgi:hypothetical protein
MGAGWPSLFFLIHFSEAAPPLRSWQGWEFSVAATFDHDTGTPMHFNRTGCCSLTNTDPGS